MKKENTTNITQQIGVKVPQKIKEIIEDYAQKRRKRTSDVVREFVANSLLKKGLIDQAEAEQMFKMSPGGDPWEREKKKAKTPKEIEEIDKKKNKTMKKVRSYRGKNKMTVNICGGNNREITTIAENYGNVDQSQKNLPK